MLWDRRSKQLLSMNEFFIDTNIFMYAAGRPHEFKEPCVSTLRGAVQLSRNVLFQARFFSQRDKNSSVHEEELKISDEIRFETIFHNDRTDELAR